MPSAMALLGLLIPPALQPAFIASVLVTSSIVAVVFAGWRAFIYERRAEYFYESTRGDDHVLVPMRSGLDASTAMLGGRLAAAHEAGKVVLLDLVEGDHTADAAHEVLRSGDPDDPGADGRDHGSIPDDAAETDGGVHADAPDPTAAMAVSELKSLAGRLESELGVPCEVVVASTGGSPARTVQRVKREAGCDLTVVPYEAEAGELTPYVNRLLRTAGDVQVHRSHGGRTRWQRITVPVRQAGDTAHVMLDFGLRVLEPNGRVSVAHCIDDEDERRVADRMLEDLVETFDVAIVARE